MSGGGDGVDGTEGPLPRLSASRLDDDRFERAARLGWFDLGRVRAARVLVVGCGAIGNELVKDLALSGFGHLDLVDMDHVVRSNLPRSALFTTEDADLGRPKAEALAAAARRLDPACVAVAHVMPIEKVADEVWRDCDLVLTGVDNIGARVFANARARAAGKPLVDSGTRGTIGKVQVVLPDRGACLECGMNRTHMQIASRRNSCTGRDVTFFEPKLAADLATTAIVAAIQTREALKLVHGRLESVLTNLFYYDGMSNVSEVLEVAQNPGCPHHVREGPP